MGNRRHWKNRAQNASEHERTRIQGNSPITVGAHTYGHDQLAIREWGEGGSLSIGKYCSLASGIEIFMGGGHRTDWTSSFPFHLLFPDLQSQPHYTHAPINYDVNIGHDVWIASGVTILPGVSIGNGAMIGAKAVVTKDVPAYGFVAGNPAKFIRSRFSAEIIERLHLLQWWDLPMEEIEKLLPILTAAPKIDELDALLRLYRPGG